MISDYLNVNLIEELGLDKLPEDRRAALVKQMEEALEGRVTIALMSSLSDADRAEANKIVETDGDLVSFIKERVANTDMIIAETVANFKVEMLEMQAMVKKHQAAS